MRIAFTSIGTDRERMAHAGACAAFAPTSNLYLGSGLFDIAATRRGAACASHSQPMSAAARVSACCERWVRPTK